MATVFQFNLVKIRDNNEDVLHCRNECSWLKTMVVARCPERGQDQWIEYSPGFFRALYCRCNDLKQWQRNGPPLTRMPVEAAEFTGRAETREQRLPIFEPRGDVL